MRNLLQRKSKLLFLLLFLSPLFGQDVSTELEAWLDSHVGRHAFWNDPSFWKATHDSFWLRYAPRLSEPIRQAWFQGLYRDARLRGEGDRLEALIRLYFEFYPVPQDTNRLFWDVLLQSALRGIAPPEGWRRALGLLRPEADSAAERVIRALVLHGNPPADAWQALKLPRAMVWGGRLPSVFPEWTGE